MSDTNIPRPLSDNTILFPTERWEITHHNEVTSHHVLVSDAGDISLLSERDLESRFPDPMPLLRPQLQLSEALRSRLSAEDLEEIMASAAQAYHRDYMMLSRRGLSDRNLTDLARTLSEHSQVSSDLAPSTAQTPVQSNQQALQGLSENAAHDALAGEGAQLLEMAAALPALAKGDEIFQISLEATEALPEMRLIIAAGEQIGLLENEGRSAPVPRVTEA